MNAKDTWATPELEQLIVSTETSIQLSNVQ